jgi:hypothetical protein
MFLRKIKKIVKIDEKWKEQYFCQHFEIKNLKEKKIILVIFFENNYNKCNFKPINNSNIWLNK